jgi:hypothetical protein
MSSAWRDADAALTTRIPRPVPHPTDARPTATLDHLGIPGDDPGGLVAAVAPVLRAAHSAGHPITAVAARRTVGLVREALGDDLVSLSPAEVLRPGPARLIRVLRAEARAAQGSSRRAVVLVEYPAAADPADVAEWEAACSLVLADLPLTLLCATARGVHADVADGVVTRHRSLLTPTGRQHNPDHRPPTDRSPSPSSLWGRRILRFTVTTADGLDRLRVRVARTAEGAGFDDDAAIAAVRAAEDAAAVAATVGDGGGELEVEVRVHDDRLVVDVVGRGGGDVPGTLPFAVPPGGAAAVHDDGATRRVRVLVPATP